MKGPNTCAHTTAAPLQILVEQLHVQIFRAAARIVWSNFCEKHGRKYGPRQPRVLVKQEPGLEGSESESSEGEDPAEVARRAAERFALAASLRAGGAGLSPMVVTLVRVGGGTQCCLLLACLLG